MDRLEQIYKLHNLLKRRRTPLLRADLEDELGLSRASVTRLLAFCRNRLHMPIETDREQGGYFYQPDQKDSYELPGLWFNRSELIGLLTSHHLLDRIQPGILHPHIAPLQKRIEQLLAQGSAGSRELFERIRILPMASRESKLEHFQQVAEALVTREQVRIIYSSRSSDEVSDRWISPQRLIYYRDNWYVDAWCHLREGLRTFSVDSLEVLEAGAAARDVPAAELDAHVTETFGIFSGAATSEAVIHFSGTAARWVADERWHPQQRSRHLGDGRWELVIPYGNPTELIRDILKFGPHAEVIAPPQLRKAVAEQLSQTLRKYRNIAKVDV
jgi:proteasome accessory factor C